MQKMPYLFHNSYLFKFRYQIFIYICFNIISIRKFQKSLSKTKGKYYKFQKKVEHVTTSSERSINGTPRKLFSSSYLRHIYISSVYSVYIENKIFA